MAADEAETGSIEHKRDGGSALVTFKPSQHFNARTKQMKRW